MAANPKIKFHEIVIPTDPLPVWFYVFQNKKQKQCIAPHWHRGIELSFVLHGKIKDFLIGKTHYSSHAGKILIVNSQEIHSINNYSHSSDKALSIIFPFEYVERFYPDITHQVIDLNNYEHLSAIQQQKYAQLVGLLTEFMTIYNTKSKFKFMRMNVLLNQILEILLENFTKEKPIKQQQGERKIYIVNRLQFITQYVNNHYQENINLSKIAKECIISKEYLARFFKKEMEITVDTYINNVRAEHAYQQLNLKNDTLTKIANDNGFSGVRTMNRAFKELYGKTASQIKLDLRK